MGNGVLFDHYTLILSSSLGLMFIISIKIAKQDLFAHIAMISILFMLFAFPRTLTYLFAPELVVLPFDQNIEVNAINEGILFVTIGTALLLAGMFAAENVIKGKKKQEGQQLIRTLDYPLLSLCIIFVITVAIELYGTVWLGVSSYGKLRADIGNTQFQILKVLFALDTLFFVVLGIVVIEKAYTKKTWLALIVIVFFAYAIYSALTGSRGTGMRSLLVVSAIFLATMGNFRPRLIPTLAMMTVIVLTGLASWQIATSIRSSIAAKHYNYLINVSVEAKDVSEESGAPIRTSNTAEFINKTNASGVTKDVSGGASQFIARVLNRMGVIDYAIQITSQPGDPKALEKYMNFKYIAKSIANSALPGLPFSEASLSTSRVINIIYRGYEEKFVLNSGYFSEFWTIWGLAYIFFGWWGGVIGLLLSGFVLHAAYIKGANLCGKYSVYYKATFLFVVTPTVCFSMGIDHSIITILTLSLQTICILILLSLIDVAFTKLVRFSGLRSSR